MAAHQAPPSLGFSRQEHWSGLPFPSPMHESEKWKGSHSAVSDSLRPHGLLPTRLLARGLIPLSRNWDPTSHMAWLEKKKKRKEINMTKIILSEQQNASYHEDQLLSSFRRRNKFLLRLLKTACLIIIEVLFSLPGREGLEISLTSLLPGLVCFLLWKVIFTYSCIF